MVAHGWNHSPRRWIHNHQKFSIILSYTGSSRLASDTRESVSQRKTERKGRKELNRCVLNFHAKSWKPTCFHWLASKAVCEVPPPAFPSVQGTGSQIPGQHKVAVWILVPKVIDSLWEALNMKFCLNKHRHKGALKTGDNREERVERGKKGTIAFLLKKKKTQPAIGICHEIKGSVCCSGEAHQAAIKNRTRRKIWELWIWRHDLNSAGAGGLEGGREGSHRKYAKNQTYANSAGLEEWLGEQGCGLPSRPTWV